MRLHVSSIKAIGIYMSKKTQYVLTICVDMIMLAILVIASYFLITHEYSGWKQYGLQAVIIVTIPSMFFITYMTFAGHKYDASYREEFEDEDSEDENPV